MRKDFRTKKRDSKTGEGRNKDNNTRDSSNRDDRRSGSNNTRSNSGYNNNNSNSNKSFNNDSNRGFGNSSSRSSGRRENRNSSRDDRPNSRNVTSNSAPGRLKQRDDRREGSFNRGHTRIGNTTQRDNKIRSRTRHKNSSNINVELGFNEYRLKGIYSSKSKRGTAFYTESFNPGHIVYDEKIVSIKNIDFREWNPKKSKLGAAIYNGCSQIGIKPGSTVLYLGCSTGTTCSHVSDIIGEGGFLFGLDVAPRVMREFIFLCEKRKNMAPLLKDAHQPTQYTDLVPKVDVVFQDIAQRDQVDIFIKNCKIFLKENGTGMIAVKARSIDVTRNPRDIFEEVRVILEKEMAICDSRTLEPYEKDHYFFVIKLKK